MTHFGTFITVALALLACPASVDQVPGEPPRPPEAPVDTSRIVSLWTMGGNNGRLADKMHSPLMRGDGTTWDEFIRQEIVPDLDWGVRTVMVHLPFGKTGTPRMMDFDSYIHAQDRGLDKLWRGFSNAWRRVADGRYTDGEPVRLIFYLGSLKYDRSMAMLLEDPRKPDEWLLRVRTSIRPILDAGGELAFDTAGVWKPDDPAYWFVGMIHAMGAGGWIEGTEYGYVWGTSIENQELIFHGHLRHLPVTANHQQYWNNIADVAHGGWRPVEGHRWAQVDDPDREVLLMISGHSAPPNPDGTPKTLTQIAATYHEWAPPMVRRNLKHGFASAVSVRRLRAQGITIEQLVRGE